MAWTLPDGRATTGKFTERVSSRLKELAAIWKQERLLKAERKGGGYTWAVQRRGGHFG